MPGEYRIKLLKGAQKDKENIRQFPALKANVDTLLAVLKTDPFQNPPPYEKLLGNMAGMYSRRINRQHRLVYEVDTAQDRPYHFHVDALRINMPDA